MGWDLRSGLEAARGEIVVVMDGDAQNPVEDILRMYRAMREHGYDVMKGRRVLRKDGFRRRLLSEGYNVLFRLFFRTHGLWDINGKPKGLTRGALSRLELASDDWFADAEIILQARRAGLSIGELPVVFHQNADRQSPLQVKQQAYTTHEAHKSEHAQPGQPDVQQHIKRDSHIDRDQKAGPQERVKSILLRLGHQGKTVEQRRLPKGQTAVAHRFAYLVIVGIVIATHIMAAQHLVLRWQQRFTHKKGGQEQQQQCGRESRWPLQEGDQAGFGFFSVLWLIAFHQ